jgi:hypothetical protein
MLSNEFSHLQDRQNFTYDYQYEMIITLPEIYNTPNENKSLIYGDDIYSINSPEKWNEKVYEVLSNGKQKILSDEKHNFNDFFDKEKKSITLSMDLNSIGLPNRYILHLEAHVEIGDKNGSKCSLIDATNGYLIPPPEYTISSLPSSIDLRPGEEKNTLLKITTNVPERNSYINISSQYNKSLIQVQFIPHSLTIPPLGSNTTIVKIKALNNISDDGLPIIQTPLINTTSRVFSFISDGDHKVNGNSQNAYISNSFSNLTITLLKTLTPEENFIAFWTAYGSFISFIGGGFAAGFSASIFQKFFKK